MRIVISSYSAFNEIFNFLNLARKFLELLFLMVVINGQCYATVYTGKSKYSLEISELNQVYVTIFLSLEAI